MTNHYILGISAYYHDSAAALLCGDQIVAAAHEERFTRKKHDDSFPSNAIRFVLEEAGILLADLTGIAFYEKPFWKFERLLETYHAFAPAGLTSFLSAIPVWTREKLFMKRMLKQELGKIANQKTKTLPPLYFPEHHLSHAAAAFYPSPFTNAAILTIDGVGEWATTTISKGDGNTITNLKELRFPHSIGLLYSAFTYYCGFRVNSGEYKLMGLAPYGINGSPEVERFKALICKELVSIKDDGSICLNMGYFNFATGLTMCNNRRWEALFGLPRRNDETPLTQAYMDLALAIQQITEEIVLKLAQTARTITQSKNLVLAGGVALNCVANGKLLRSKIFDEIWIQPAAGDAGGALGAAYATYFLSTGNPRSTIKNQDRMQGSYWGPSYCTTQAIRLCKPYKPVYKQLNSFDDVCTQTSKLIADGNVVGWIQGKSEWGPRALGNRSILGDARNPAMQKKLNLKIKYREGFRPFAPAVRIEDVGEYFELNGSSPYMLLVAQVRKPRCIPYPDDATAWDLWQRLYFERSDLPAITHIDYSARVQTIHQETNPQFWQLLTEFKKQTGCGVLVNTSFNVRGEPIVNDPADAYRCFMRTEMDYLVIGDLIFDKREQLEWKEKDEWKREFVLD